MGGHNSKQASGGTLSGAVAPPLPGVAIPTPPKPKKTYNIRVNPGRKAGDVIMVSATDGSRFEVKIPPRKVVGDLFEVHQKAETHKVFTSTLPSLPGMEIVQAKRIVWGSVSHSFTANAYDQESMGERVSELLQEAKTQIMEQTIKVGCNAVLGMTFNVTNDSSGDHGHFKNVIVTACGTPCSVVPMATSPTVTAHVIVDPVHVPSGQVNGY